MGFVLFSLDILGNALVNNPLSVSLLLCAQLYPLFASFFVVISCLLFLFHAVGVVNSEFTLCCCPCGYSMLLSVKGFQELFLCGCIIIKQGCIFELGRIYGLCIFCPMFLKRKQNYVLIGDKCLKKKVSNENLLCLVLSCLVQYICWGSVQKNWRSSKQAGCLFQARLRSQQTWLPFPALLQASSTILSELCSFSSALCMVREGILVHP